MARFIRRPTREEKRDFVPIMGGPRTKTAKQKFEEELAKKSDEIRKEGKPFFDKAARDDFNDYYSEQVKKNVRKNGYLKAEEIEEFKPNWKKYSNIDNFEIVDEGERYDKQLTKENPGLRITKKYTKYRYKGYNGGTTVMEPTEDAIARAQAKSQKQKEQGAKKHSNSKKESNKSKSK